MFIELPGGRFIPPAPGRERWVPYPPRDPWNYPPVLPDPYPERPLPYSPPARGVTVPKAAPHDPTRPDGAKEMKGKLIEMIAVAVRTFESDAGRAALMDLLEQTITQIDNCNRRK